MESFVVALLLILGLAQTNGLNADPIAFVEDVRNAAGSRIVGGWEAAPAQIPHQVSLRMINTNGAVGWCGGSLISDQWVLTAGHCIDARLSFMVRLGVTEMSRPAYLHETAHRFLHPLYIEFYPFFQVHDIGLIKLNRAVRFSGSVRPVRLQSSLDRDEAYEDVVLTASGFGLTDDTINGGTRSDVLRWVLLRGISNQHCLDWYSDTTIQPEVICARYYNETSQTPCDGDSGGPLTLVDEDGQLTQVGIAAFVHRTGCNNDHPAGFIRPGYYHEWITSVTGLQLDWTR